MALIQGKFKQIAQQNCRISANFESTRKRPFQQCCNPQNICILAVLSHDPMTREDQLKFCSVCINRKIGNNHETICGLTNAKADFDPICRYYEFDRDVYRGSSSSGSGGISGGAILSIVVALISILRLASTCNNTSRSHRDDFSQSQIDKIIREQENRREREQIRDQIGDLSPIEKEELGIKKATKDSTIVIDKFIEYTLLRNEYLMSTLIDDKTKLMARDKKNFMFVIHKFNKSDKVIAEWQKFRTVAGSKVSPTTITYKILDDNTFSYIVKNSFAVTHGKARYYFSDKNCYVYQYESSNKQNEIMVDIGFDQVVMDHIHLKR